MRWCLVFMHHNVQIYNEARHDMRTINCASSHALMPRNHALQCAELQRGMAWWRKDHGLCYSAKTEAIQFGISHISNRQYKNYVLRSHKAWHDTGANDRVAQRTQRSNTITMQSYRAWHGLGSSPDLWEFWSASTLFPRSTARPAHGQTASAAAFGQLVAGEQRKSRGCFVF